jgi:beta-glucanase (GH16 family)
LSRPLLRLAAAVFALAVFSGLASGSVGRGSTEDFAVRVQSNATASRAPGPIAGKGYHLVFKDDFSHFRKRVWTRYIWYDEPPPHHAVYTQNGVLHLVSRRSQGYNIITVTTRKSRSFQRGYFEARIRWTKGDGAWPGFWLLSTRHAKNPAWPNINPYCANHGLDKALCYSSELDVFEGQGSEPRVFYGTVHRNSSGDYGVDDDQNGNNYHPQRKNLTTRFHRYGALWTGSQITWYLDGKKLMSTSTYDSTNQPMFLILQMWTGGWTQDPNSSTPDNLDTRVDWVKVWRP